MVNRKSIIGGMGTSPKPSDLVNKPSNVVLKRTISSRDDDLMSNRSEMSSISKVNKKKNSLLDAHQPSNTEMSWSQMLFPGLPDHYPLRKKITITKNNSSLGSFWDILQIVLSVVTCVMYIADSYTTNYTTAYIFLMTELIITQLFMIDFLLNWYLDSTIQFLWHPLSLIDVFTIVPVYLTLATQSTGATNLGFLRFVRILRLVRIFRTFKALRNLSGIKRQLLSLILTLLSMTFLAAGLVQLMENDIEQYQFDCQYINSATYWEPSCTSTQPAEDDTCDCSSNNCEGYYLRGDKRYHPTGIRCIRLTYFDAFYFIIVTVSTVGYGDISPTTMYSRIVVLVFIVASLVIIPMQVNKLQVLIAMRSPYRNPYKAIVNENHIILCGHVNDKGKLEQFFKEFFHPDRAFSSSPEFHAVVLSPLEPTEDVRNLILSPMLDSRVTFVIGSALVMEDLKKVRADIASGMFFLCNTEVPSSAAALEDAATVMRALSVSNFNPDLDCLVQVLKPEDRTILKDSDVDVILCLDEFKTALQARNAICPGFSTFIENIFHSFGGVSQAQENSLDPWYQEYLHGARMEMYYVPLDPEFLRAIGFSFDRLCEAIYIEYGIVVLGLCSSDQDEMTFNPTLKDLEEHKSFKSFFSTFNVALIIADDQMQAEQVTKGLSDMYVISHMLSRMEEEENKFRCHPPKEEHDDDKPKALGRNLSRSRSGLKAFSTIKSGITGMGMNKGLSSKAADFEMIAKNNSTRDDEPISDDDSDDEYVGYANNEPAAMTAGRRMSASAGGGMVMASQGSKKNLISNRRQKLGDSMLSQQMTVSRVEEDNEEDENEEDEAKEIEIKPRLSVNGRTRGSLNRPNSFGAGPNKSKASLFSRFKKANTSGNVLDGPTGGDHSTSPIQQQKKMAVRNTLKNMYPDKDKDKDTDTGKDKDDARKRAQSSESYVASIDPPPRPSPPSPSELMRKFPGSSRNVGDVETIDNHMAKFGNPSKVIDQVELENHIIVVGNEANFHLFLSELRRPAVKGTSYHPIVLLAMTIPPKWETICAKYNDVYLLIGSLTRSAVFNKINIEKAFAVILLASRDGITKVEEENIDSGTLFVYLKLEQYIPRHVFFSVELTCSSNMAVLNATIMRRSRITPDEYLTRQESMDQLDLLALAQAQAQPVAPPQAHAALVKNPSVRKSMLHAQPKDNDGRFTSKRASVRHNSTSVNPNVLSRASSNIGRRASTIDGSAELLAVMKKKEEENKKPPEHENPEQKFWDATDTHHMLPVFAAARAYVPSTFESLLVQSFFGVLTPLICEKLVCGQSGQTVMQIDVPNKLVGRVFLDLFRKFSYHHLIAFGLYRTPRKEVKAILPYVFISAPATVVLERGDRVFVYGKPSRIARALNAINHMEGL
mgnify:FL=1